MLWLAALIAALTINIALADDHGRQAPAAAINAVMILHSANVIDHGLQRQSKGDRLPHTQATDPLSEVGAIEVSERGIVLRAQHGDVAFSVDPARRTTSIAKGYSVPQITVDFPARKTLESAPVLAGWR